MNNSCKEFPGANRRRDVCRRDRDMTSTFVVLQMCKRSWGKAEATVAKLHAFAFLFGNYLLNLPARLD